MAENFPMLGGKWVSRFMKLKCLKGEQPKKNYNKTYYNQIASFKDKKENFESIKRKATYHV